MVGFATGGKAMMATACGAAHSIAMPPLTWIVWPVT